MKTYTIAVQDGLDAIKALLQEKGHTIVPYSEINHTANIAIISGVDSAYEEIETAQCLPKKSGAHEMLLINATSLTPEQVLHHIEHNLCI